MPAWCYVTDITRYAFFAFSSELNRRAFRKKLDLFPEELRYYVILANSIIGLQNARRVPETPEAVVEDSREFVEKLLSMAPPGADDRFKEVLETYLIETMKDELRHCCPNCQNFSKCLNMDNLAVGGLFMRLANGEETDELKKETAAQIESALLCTPYIDTDRAHELCRDFRHQYQAPDLGEVFGRYSAIAAELRDLFGIDYRKVQQKMIGINMEFVGKDGADTQYSHEE